MAVEDVVDDYSGMISKDMAKDIIENRPAAAKKAKIKEILEGRYKVGEIADVEGSVYRVFNARHVQRSGAELTIRNLSLSDGGDFITLALRRKAAEMVDLIGVERGDTIVAKNVAVASGTNGFSIVGLNSTYVVRLRPLEGGIVDFSTLRGGEKDIDIIGKLTTLGPIRYFVALNGRQNSVTRCVISDNRMELPLVLWGSSSEAAQNMHPGDYVKIEFAAVKQRDDTLEINANEFSRIFASSKLGRRLTAPTSGRNGI